MNATETMSELRRAIRETPLDSALRRVFADALEELEDNQEAAQFNRCFADILDNPLNSDLVERIEKAIEKANGQMRRRTVGFDRVARLCSYCVDPACSVSGGYFLHGGTVANRYNYPASTAIVLVVLRKDGKLCVDGGQGNAKSPTPASIWEEVKQWRESNPLRQRLQEWAAAR
jgi:uncharacterized protein (TIGR02996 family)